ncbi:sensor histidine kinase [Glaciecola petra]|uniref:Histidine kinase n=1 Tax=Glaciecola petra TaxID=3075602 RepID=A0ABU2ZWV6_9ALTE|nr:histidine kinase [Aestuariibacter sp. P117]MDT0596059.1 histidine kinase [Aestuariibacter sp. P117]
MQSNYFYWLQLLFWSIVFTLITGTILLGRSLGEYEIYLAISLIGTTALYSCLSRHLYKKWIKGHSLGKEIAYFTLQSLMGGVAGVSAMITVVLLLGLWGFIPAVPREIMPQALSSMFWGNWLNMMSASLFWSIGYLLVVKVRQIYEVKEALASSQLDVLSQQLNPHFLFNTLNNIRAVILEDPEKARNALTQLSEMLRYTLNHQDGFNKPDKVSLSEELNITHEYISLCEIQFEQRLQFEVNVPEAAKTALIPKMLLQLCIENAIKHGIAKLPEGGIVSVVVRLQPSIDEALQNDNPGSICIEVINPVTTTPTYERLQTNESNTKLGIKNIQKRLKLLYNKSKQVASFTLNIEQNTARATILLPLEFAEEKGNRI